MKVRIFPYYVSLADGRWRTKSLERPLILAFAEVASQQGLGELHAGELVFGSTGCFGAKSAGLVVRQLLTRSVT